MICTGIPHRCQCKGACPMIAAKQRGDEITPINDAAREAMTKRGEKFDPAKSAALERFLKGTP